MLFSQVTVTTPTGWNIESSVSNQKVVLSESREGNQWTWQAHNVTAIETEEWARRRSNGYTQLRLMVDPTKAAHERHPLLSWTTWGGVARYINDLFADPMQPTAVIDAKSRELVGEADDREAKLQAIARFVQDINYISLSIDLEEGGGYTPHYAEETLRAYYGDCKDKSSLMCSILSSAGIEAYPVLARIGDNEVIDPKWPSPNQFDHCIVAVRTSESDARESVVHHPELGRLLIFDPTSPYTTLGHLSHRLQSAYGLLVAPVAEPLIRFSHEAPESNREKFTASATLEANGDLDAKCSLRFTGLKADPWRSEQRAHSRTELQDRVNQWTRTTTPTAKVSGMDFVDLPHEDRAQLDFGFSAAGYARSIGGGRMLIFQPGFLSRETWVPPEDEHRQSNVSFKSESTHEELTLILPEGYVADELPPLVEIETSFARYRCASIVRDSTLIYERELTWLPSVTLAASEYEELRAFYKAMVEAESTPVVLVRQ